MMLSVSGPELVRAAAATRANRFYTFSGALLYVDAMRVIRNSSTHRTNTNTSEHGLAFTDYQRPTATMLSQ